MEVMDEFVGEDYRLPGVLVMSRTQYRHLRFSDVP